MRFCKDCNNMLYPKENKEKNLLMFSCRNCDYTEKTDENEVSLNVNCVYRNSLKHGQFDFEVDNCIINDPTYTRTKKAECPKCKYNEAIFFQGPNIDSDLGMRLIFVCCRKDEKGCCGTKWSN